jgi:hypothetical protein
MIIPFPLTRHGKDGVPFIASVVARMLELPEVSAERHLHRQLQRKADALRRRGFDARTIEAEIAKAEAAIRVAVVRAEGWSA